jgi:ankyrin repeat protein
MGNLPESLIGEFIDAAVQDRVRAERLLSAHPDLIDARWIHGETVLHFLAVEGFTDAVRFLAERGADVNAVNEFGDPPLIDIAVLEMTETAEVLLSHGANPNARSPTRDYPLECAVRSGNARLVALLLEAGANGLYVTDLGESVFDALPQSGEERASLVAILAQHGIVPDAGGQT